MDAEQTLFPLGATMGVGGGIIWLSPLFRTIQRSRFSIFELLFLLAPLVIVPLTLNLIPGTGEGWLSRLVRRVVLYGLPFAAILVVGSFHFVSVGGLAGVSTLPWLFVGLTLAVDGFRRLFQTRCRSFPEFCFAFGEGYALVGALWLMASRLGLQPVGFHEPIVLLTAVHFHYAGLMAAVLAGFVASSKHTPLPLRIALFCAVLGPAVLGIAFLVGPKLKLAAVMLIAIGECGIALGTLRIGLANASGIGGQMLILASAYVICGMALAGIWAVGEYPLHAFVNLGQMARYHGVLNSVGFGLCSLIGWTLLRKKSLPA